MCRTLALARQVNTLSTKVLSDHSVSSNGAFFRERRFSRHVLLLVLLSSASLASCSTPLRVYVFFPNNHIRLASFRGPHSANSMALTTFHNTPGQSFAFISKKDLNLRRFLHNGIALPLSYLRTYQEVLSQLLHTLLDTEYNTPNVFCLASYSTTLQVSPYRFNSCAATLPLLATQTL